MAFAPDSVRFIYGDGSIMGSFTEKDAGNYFEFSKNDEEMTDEWNFPHKIWVTNPWDGMDSGFRYGEVMQTRVYICTDENDDGTPVVEKWMIKSKRNYK